MSYVLAIVANVLRLFAGGDLAVQMLNLVQKPIRITGVQFSTNAPLAQNRCWWLVPFHTTISNLETVNKKKKPVKCAN